MVIKFTKIVDAPIDLCFGTIIGDSRVQRWLGGEMVTEYTVIAEDQMEGSDYRLSYPPFWELRGEITSYKKPTVFGVEFTSNILGTKGNFIYHLKELEPKKTEVNFDLEINDDNAARHAALNLLMGQIDKACVSHLDTIKEIAETKGSKTTLPK